jgi:hypothetical protein
VSSDGVAGNSGDVPLNIYFIVRRQIRLRRRSSESHDGGRASLLATVIQTVRKMLCFADLFSWL